LAPAAIFAWILFRLGVIFVCVRRNGVVDVLCRFLLLHHPDLLALMQFCISIPYGTRNVLSKFARWHENADHFSFLFLGESFVWFDLAGKNDDAGCSQTTTIHGARDTPRTDASQQQGRKVELPQLEIYQIPCA
jgi:hypothetical protein